MTTLRDRLTSPPALLTAGVLLLVVFRGIPWDSWVLGAEEISDLAWINATRALILSMVLAVGILTAVRGRKAPRLRALWIALGLVLVIVPLGMLTEALEMLRNYLF